MNFRSILTLILLFCAVSTYAERKTEEMAYSKPDRCRLIISHHGDNSSRPVVIWFHGGGLVSGNAYIPDELKDTDYVIVSPNYRLLPKVSIDSCITDAAAAIAWTFRNVEKYGGDPSKIFVSGHSAGGYLASMVGFDKSWLARHDIDSDSIAGLIPFSGQAITHYEWRKMNGIPELQPTIDRYAPLYHVRKDAPPYIMICGDRELELFGRYEENAYLHRMLKLTGHPDTSIYELDGYNHGDMVHPAFHILKSQITRLLHKNR